MKSFFTFLLAGAAFALPSATTVTSVAGVKAVLTQNAAQSVQAAGYTCAKGQYLTYSIATNALPGITLAKAQAYFSKWTQDGPGSQVSSTGNNAVGSTRVWWSDDAALASPTVYNETLTTILPPVSGNSNLEQKWSARAPQVYYRGSLTFYQSWNDLTIREDSSGNVSLQYYINCCASNQQLAYKALPVILQDALNYWIPAAKAS